MGRFVLLGGGRMGVVTTDVQLRAAVAILVAGALVLHVLMLTDGHALASTPTAAADARADTPTIVQTAQHDARGERDVGDEHGAAGLTGAACFSVLAGTVLATRPLRRPQSPPTRAADPDGALLAAAQQPAPTLTVARHGPAWAVPVDAGILLRV